MTAEIARIVEATATLYGVEAAWVDNDGGRHAAPVEVILDVLGRLGAPVAGVDDLDAAARLRRREIWERVCPPVRVALHGDSPSVPIRLPADRARGPLEWRLVTEAGRVVSGSDRVEELGLAGGSSVDGRRFEIRRLDLPADLPSGRHRLVVRHGAGEWPTRIVVAPRGTYRGGRLARCWGVFHPLYGLRGRRGAGVGDFGVLGDVLSWTAERGGAVFGTTPLLAGFADRPVDPSPYAPASRLFWDDRYVDFEAAPGFAAARDAGALEGLERLAGHLSDEFVPWDPLSATTDEVLSELAGRFFASGGEERRDFQNWIAGRPDAVDYAAFRAARAEWGRDWRSWPEPARSGRPPAEALDARVIRRHLYGQWVASGQMDALAPAAVGSPEETEEKRALLYLDIPLGSHPDGYDVWRYREQFVEGVSAAAPPDEFFRGGQDWGLPPLHPERIREDGFDYVAEVMRHTMGAAGLVRIDHVMQLHRLFWVPTGARPIDGVYVRYPADELAAVVAIESVRAGCEVAGEDLGTVPDAVRDLMDRWGMRRTSVLGFGIDASADGEQEFHVAPESVATIETHDMVPLAGLRAGVDIADRLALGLIEEEEARELEARRAAAFARLDAAAAGPEFDAADTTVAPLDPLVAPLLTRLGAGPAGIVLASLDDLFGIRMPQNVPGTVTERPNWRRRLPGPLRGGLPNGAEPALDALDVSRRSAA